MTAPQRRRLAAIGDRAAWAAATRRHDGSAPIAGDHARLAPRRPACGEGASGMLYHDVQSDLGRT